MTTPTHPLLPRPTNPVSQPIINSPFHAPDYHWDLDTSAKALPHALCGRRESQNIPPVAGSRKMRGHIGLTGQFGAVWTPLKLVNDIRKAVLDWQEVGYPGATQTTRDLIDHWTNPDACELYFAQLDAVLTHIYLHEAPRGDIAEEIQRINDKYNAGIRRIAHKMATATGKTPVMAMLILWQTANHRNAAADDHRFVRRFLVLTPGLTVRERLQDSLDPGHEANDWTHFKLIPPGDQWERALTSASVNIVNYHQMEPKQVGEPMSDKGWQLIKGGSRPTTQEEIAARTETARDVIERITDGKSQQGHILVINDEGHHCHRGDPDNKTVQQDTRWFAGITQISDEGLLHYVTDMSATPIFLAQSNPRPTGMGLLWCARAHQLVDPAELCLGDDGGERLLHPHRLGLVLCFRAPDQSPRVSLFGEDAVDAGLAPELSPVAGDALGVQGVGDVGHPLARLGKVEDALDHAGCILVGRQGGTPLGPVLRHDPVVAVGGVAGDPEAP